MSKKTTGRERGGMQPLERYYAKLKTEALFKALLCGLLAGAFTAAIAAGIALYANIGGLALTIGLFFAVASATAAALYFWRFCPSMESVARRLDGLGLEERVITMLDLAAKEDCSEIAAVQKENVLAVLQRHGAKAIKLRVFTKPVFCVLIAAAFAFSAGGAVFSVLSVRSAQAAAAAEEAREDEIIQGLLDELRELIDQSEAGDGLKESLYGLVDDTEALLKNYTALEEKIAVLEETRRRILDAIANEIIETLLEELREIIDESGVREGLKELLHGLVDDTEASLKNYTALEDKIAEIEETRQKILDLIAAELSKTTIAEELKERESTEKLGEAIESGGEQEIDDAFEDMLSEVKEKEGEEKREAALQAAQDIEDSLNEASDTDSALEQALKELAEALREAARESSEGAPDEETDKAVQEATEKAAQAVKDALKGEEKAKGAGDKLKEKIDEALEALEKLATKSGGGGDGDGDGDGEGEAQNAGNGQGTGKGGESGEGDGEGEGSGEGKGDGDGKGAGDGGEGEGNGGNGAGKGAYIGDGNEENSGSGCMDDNEYPVPPEGSYSSLTVIDGQTPYLDVFDAYYEQLRERIQSGSLTDEQIAAAERYFEMLKART